MANSGSRSANFPGRPAFQLQLRIARHSISGRRTRWNWVLVARNPERRRLTWNAGSHSYSVNVLGEVRTGTASALDFRDGALEKEIARGTTGWYQHNNSGNLTVYGNGSYGGGIFGRATISTFSFTAHAYVRPNRPSAPRLSNPRVNGFTLRYGSHPWNGGRAIDRGQIQYSTNSNFSSPVNTVSNAGSPTAAYSVTVARPGTRYWVRVRLRNSVGWSDWSPSRQIVTLPAAPPVLDSVTLGAAGRHVFLQATPPSGGAPSSYIWEMRPPGQTTWQTRTSSGSTYTWTGLTPGLTYAFRVRVSYGGSNSGVSNTITVTTPQPNASAGTYWDGDTPASGETVYSWEGTPGASVSIASSTGGALGWLNDDDITVDSGGTAIQVRVADELFDGGAEFAAMYVFTADTDDNGARFGTDGSTHGAPVTEEGQYVGSLYAVASKDIEMSAQILWYDGAGEFIDASEPSSPVPVGVAEPVRLFTTADAPEGAMYAGVIAVDAPGSPLLVSGDTVTVDGAMLSTGQLFPYFDGDTPDTFEFRYDWTPSARGDISLREDIPVAEQDPLADPSCPPLPAAPRPPAIGNECVDEVGVWRRYWALVPEQNVSSWADSVPTLILTTGAEPERQVRVRYYANPDGLDPEQFDSSSWEAEQIVSYIPANTRLVIDGVSERAWATVGDGERIAADSLLYGTGNAPATWAALRCGVSYLMSFDTPLDSPSGNLRQDIEITRRS